MSGHTGYTDSTSTDRPPAWQQEGECARLYADGRNVYDPESFFPIGNTGPAIRQIAEAKAVCCRCEVVETCKRWAMDTGQDAGVWGGLSEDERKSLKRRDARLRRAVGDLSDVALKRTDTVDSGRAIEVVQAASDAGMSLGEIAARTRHVDATGAGVGPDTLRRLKHGTRSRIFADTERLILAADLVGVDA